VASNRVGDAQVLPDLLVQIPNKEGIARVSGDGAYNTKARYSAIADLSADAVMSVRITGIMEREYVWHPSQK